MPYYFKIYAKVSCPFCVDVINKMNEHGFDHALILLDKAPDYHSTLKNYYEHDTVPIVVKVNSTDGAKEFIGGCDDFSAWLLLQGFENA